MINCSRSQSLYSAEYVEPILNIEELNTISESDPRHFKPIRPPYSARTLSFFYDPQVRRFINIMMWEGDREAAENILNKAFFHVKAVQVQKYNEADEDERQKIVVDPRRVMAIAIENIKPVVNITKCFRGGVSYTVPTPAPEYYKEFLAIKWIIGVVEADVVSPYRIWQRLAREFINGMNKEGKAYEKKIELHRTAEANRAFAHFRWIK